MKVVLELQLRPGYGGSAVYMAPDRPLRELLAQYPWSVVQTAAESNGLEITKVSVTD